MTPLAEQLGLLVEGCRALVQVGLGLALQSTLLLLVGLLIGQLLRRYGPTLTALVYKVTVAGVISGALLSISLGGHLKPLWVLALPPAQEMEGGAPVEASRDLHEIPVSMAPRARLTGGPGLGISKGVGRGVKGVGTASRRLHPSADALPPPQRASAAVTIPSPFKAQDLGPSWLGWLYLAIVGLWTGRAIWLLARLALCHQWIRTVRKEAAAVEAGEAAELLQQLCERQRLRPPRLLASPHVCSPFLTGLWRPAILLPASYAQEFDRPALQAVLAHELAHLARGDCAWILMTRLTCAVGWMQPLLWLLGRRLEESSEEACDQVVLQHACAPRAYARCLVDLAERMLFSRHERLAGTGVAASRSSLERRVRSILNSSHPVPVRLSARLRAAVGLGALAAVSLGLMLVSAAAAPLEKRGKDPLADDPRLARKIKVTAEGLPVGDLLTLIAKETGIGLSADQDIADDKVIVFGPARPLREVLADLAALFNNRWERWKVADGALRYRLIRTVRAGQYEALLARRTTEQMMAQLEQVVGGLALTPEELSRPENEVLSWSLSEPEKRFAVLLYSMLSQRQRETLFARESLRISFPALTPAQQEQVRKVFAGIIAEEQAFRDEKVKQLPPEFLPGPPVSTPEDLERGEIRFQLFHSGGRVFAYLQFGKRHSLGIMFAGFSDRAQWLLPPHGNPYTGEAVPEGTSLPDGKAVRAAAAEKAWPDRLRRLAEESGRALMADYYRGKRITESSYETRASKSGDPTTTLDALCEGDGYSWWVQGKTLLLRKRDWFHQRRYETPDRWLLEMVRRAQRGPLTCADVLRVLDLTDDQILGLQLLQSGPGEGHPGEYEPFNRAEKVAGLRELLAIMNATPRKHDQPLENSQYFHHDGTPFRGFALNHARMTPRQRQMVPGFLAAQDYPVSPADPEKFSISMFCSVSKPRTTSSGYRYQGFTLAWDTGGQEKISLGYVVCLPASLPDDRRDRTKIEVLP
jgi:beta-lactamase regulating signal transducer with metallopeptidase domain